MKIHLSILLVMLLTGTGGAAQAAAAPVVTLLAPHCHATLTAAPCNLDGTAAPLAPAAGRTGKRRDGAVTLPGDDLQALDEYLPEPAQAQAPAADAAPVPEPAQFLMLLAGVILLGLRSTRQEKYDKFSA
ncbi:MAG TPA: hypothetical protein VFT05_08085 [Burkholderiaceae bacterium]|nr:hypothetical protein [Burkholderiaceae bacterium]